MKNKLLFYFSFLVLVLVGYSCIGPEPSPSPAKEVLASDADALSKVLVIPNAMVVDNPVLPQASPIGEAPVVSHFDNDIAYSAGSKIVLPMSVSGLTAIKGVYIQVKGASKYFDVPINNNASAATFVIPVDLPIIVGEGTFTLVLKFYDANKKVSVINEVKVTVTKMEDCGITKVSGGQGLTSNMFKIPKQPGKIKISYETFTVKDKIDVFQNGVWIGGTGPQTDRSTIRKAANCSVATEDKGYVGRKSEFLFDVDPDLGTIIEVVVSGCENGGTKWEYTFSCPGATASASLPTVSTAQIAAIEKDKAKSGGNITSDNGAAITARGVVWSTAQKPTTSLNTKTTDGSGKGTFESSMTALLANTKYYVRAYATNSAGTAYGNEVSFTTSANVNLSLDGDWESSTGNGVTILGSSGKFYKFNSNYQEATAKGLIKLGDIGIKDIKKTSTYKWTCFTTSIYRENQVPKVIVWSEMCTLTMANDGKSFTITGVTTYKDLTSSISNTYTRK